MDQKEIHLSRVDASTAAALLAGCQVLDPSGMTTERDMDAMTERGLCFAATAPDSQAVYVIKVANGVAWVSACKGFGPVDWANTLLPIIEAQAKGCAAVAFQTKRRGLVRQAKKQGYEVAGYIMKKAIQ